MTSSLPQTAEAASQVVLVVEDEALIRMSLAIALEDSGFTVIEANGADAALREFAQRQDITIVITDVRMPGSMDGIGLCNWLRDHEPAVPFIICSGRETLTDLQGFHPSVFRVAAKPYSPDAIVDHVRQMLGQPDV